MPRIKRYWPCSHGFNRDPEIREMRQTYADWMGYVWQEMCAIGDLNDGEVKGSPEQIGLSLAYVSLTKRPSLAAKCITNALGFMEKRGWIVVRSDRVLIVNHAKYHAYQTKERIPPNDPNERSERTIPPNPPKKAAAQPNGFAEFWFLYPKKKSKGDAEKAWRKINPSAEFLGLILAGVRRAKSSRAWLKQSGEFIPYPATWLRAKGWEDQEVITYSAPKAVPKREPEKKMTDEELARGQKIIEETIEGLSHKMGIK